MAKRVVKARMRTLAAGNPDGWPGAGLKPARPPGRQRAVGGFTLLELLVVLAIVGLASAGVGFALRDDTQTRLEREALRLAALLEAARAQAQVRGVPVRWLVTPQGFRFEPDVRLDAPDAPRQWLDPDTHARLQRAGQDVEALVLGPDPIIEPQAVLLSASRQPQSGLRLATDGVRPFAVQAGTP